MGDAVPDRTVPKAKKAPPPAPRHRSVGVVMCQTHCDHTREGTVCQEHYAHRCRTCNPGTPIGALLNWKARLYLRWRRLSRALFLWIFSRPKAPPPSTGPYR